ncbi:MAG: penicillin-binding protein activator [Gammaproteobacteria bacterium]|nr:penicillin-binding protein activator [Gammaproteobacteria bacterium]
MRPALLASAIVMMTLLPGCATPPTTTVAMDAPALLKNATQQEKGGQLEAAARDYQRLAPQVDAKQGIDYRLHAAELLARGNYLDQAQHVLDNLPKTLPANQHVRAQTLRAKLALSQQQSELALGLLNFDIPAQLDTSLKRDILYLRAEAYSGSGRYAEAARSRIALTPLITDDLTRDHNTDQIWSDLMQGQTKALQQSLTGENNADYISWATLALLVKQAEQAPGTLSRQLDAWLARYPSHSVPDTILSSLRAREATQLKPPTHLALLLPLTGNFARPAASIRDGFLSGYFRTGNFQPQITVYDTTQFGSDSKAYSQAISDGADFIVGPLDKGTVSQLGRSGTLPVPTLTLNYSEDSPPYATQLYQFGLSPEDEARMVADRAWLDGHNQTLILFPKGEWGERVVAAFSEHWKGLGGIILDKQAYASNDNDFTPQIQQLLELTDSQQRLQALRSVLQQPIQFEPRRRQDADFVFLVAFPRQARLLRPQMKFHYAGDLALYSTSHVYSGQPDSAADRDMDDILFCDMPWLINPSNDMRQLRKDIDTLWPEQGAQYARFFALGIDAYSLVPQLSQMALFNYQTIKGQTGVLQLDGNQRITRQLSCGQFKNGLARAL